MSRSPRHQREIWIRQNSTNPRKSGEARGLKQFEGRHGARWVFSASERAVNLAARLADVARAGQILISAETGRRVGDRYTVESEGKRKFKNIEEGAAIFSIVKRA